ncbi:MAG: hypothetical protein V4707_05525 [Pseudomonadota bacterium]
MKTMFKGLLLVGLASAGVATAAWAVQAQHGFNPASLDADGDGVISMVELDAHADQLFAHTDANKDGQLSGDEMRTLHGMMQSAGVAMPQGHTPPASVDQAGFRSGLRSHAVQLDADKDGRLTVAELGAAMHGAQGH